MIASSPASNLLSRTIPLKPSWAVGGPQKSNATTEELILPCRSALVTGYSARLVRSFTTPLNGYCIRLLPCLNGSNQPHGVVRQRALNDGGLRLFSLRLPRDRFDHAHHGVSAILVSRQRHGRSPHLSTRLG